MWVVLYHFVGRPFAPAELGPLQPVIDRGYLGVDAFFLLSGLIIAHTWRERGERPVGEFLWARIARVWPAHAAVMVAFAVLVGLHELLGRGLVGSYPLDGFLRHLLLIDAWGLTTELTWNYPAWSISAEWAAYLAAPLVLTPLLRGRRTVLAAALVAGVLVLGAAQLPTVEGLAAWTDERALARIAATFTAGVAIAALVRPGERRRPAGLLLAGLLVGIGLVAGTDVVVVTGFGVLLAALYAWPAMDVPVPLLRLGVWSYALYLVHALVQVSVESALGDTALDGPAAAAGLAGAVVLSTGLAALVHHAVEEPARRWLRDRRPALAGPVRFAARVRAAVLLADRDVQVVLVEGVGEGPPADAVEGPRRPQGRRPGLEQPARERVAP